MLKETQDLQNCVTELHATELLSLAELQIQQQQF